MFGSDMSHCICRRARNGLIAATLTCLLWPAAAPGGELAPSPEQARHELRLPDLDGRTVSLDQYRGKVVLVNFWASWCTPCVEEMPDLMRLQTAMRDLPFQMIGVNVAENPRRVRTAARRMKLAFPVLLDRDSATFDAWGAEILPTSYVLDATGRRRYRVIGPLDWDDPDIVDTLRVLATTAAQRASAASQSDTATRPPGRPGS